jgi:5-oxoprolinase (ATP-hydrolysing) subunit B
MVHPYGENAILVDVPATRSPAAVAQSMTGRAGIVDAVPGAHTVLIEYERASWSPEALQAALRDTSDQVMHDAGEVEITVRYDGPDLNEVAHLTGLTTDEVIRRHLEARYKVAFCGFTPGFAYLTGLDPSLFVPRRDAPRTSVPAGAVAIAGEFSAIYPRSSPGGWRLLGHTDAPLWDAERDPPALLRPGMIVRLVAA